MNGVRTSDLMVYGALALGAYLIYQFIVPPVKATKAALDAAAQGIANLWVSLTAQPSMNLQGNIQLPDGTQAPISTLPIRTDTAGNVYTNIGGVTYQLHAWVQDAVGNPVWPATVVGT